MIHPVGDFFRDANGSKAEDFDKMDKYTAVPVCIIIYNWEKTLFVKNRDIPPKGSQHEVKREALRLKVR